MYSYDGLMEKENMLKQKMQSFKKLNKAYSNQGVSIIMVIIAMSFVGVLVSIVMLAALYNFYMKGVDRKAKDNFYSAETALEEIRAGIQRDVSAAFSSSYMSILADYGRSDTGRDERFAQMYTDEVYRRLKAADKEECYDEEVLRSFITQPRGDYDDENKGAWLETDKKIAKSLQRYTDGIRLKGLEVSYVDDDGYMSIISTDFLIKIPDLNLGRPGDVPDILNYCLIANEELKVENAKQVQLKGSVYGGQNGINMNHSAKLTLGRADFQNSDVYSKNAKIFVSTDGEINVGESTVADNGNPASLVLEKGTENGVDLWAAGINLYGSSGNNVNCDLNGDIYLQDDLSVAGKSNYLKLAGNFCGYGNANDNAKDSSSIVINGTDTRLDFTGLNSLELAGNSFISVNNASDTDQGTINDVNIKTGNSVTSKAEQLAYLIPAEMIWIDNKGTESLKMNPVPYDKYADYKARITKPDHDGYDPTRYKEVDFSLGGIIPDTALSNYGVNFKIAMPQSKATDTKWVYYYFTFNSAYNANRFFQDYFGETKNQNYLSSYIDNYISDFKINPSLLDKDNTAVYLAGNMINRVEGKNGSYQFQVHPANNVSVDETNAINTKYAELSQKYQTLIHTLQDNAYALTAGQLKQTVFENLIDEDLFRSELSIGQTVFFRDSTDVSSNPEEDLAALIRPSGGTFVLDDSFLEAHEHLHLLVVDGNVDVIITTKFEGIIIANGIVTMKSSATITAYPNTYNRMANCFLAMGKGTAEKTPGSGLKEDMIWSDGKRHSAVYFFHDGLEPDWEEDGDADSEEESTPEETNPDENDDGRQTITSSDLIVPENWVKY